MHEAVEILSPSRRSSLSLPSFFLAHPLFSLSLSPRRAPPSALARLLATFEFNSRAQRRREETLTRYQRLLMERAIRNEGVGGGGGERSTRSMGKRQRGRYRRMIVLEVRKTLGRDTGRTPAARRRDAPRRLAILRSNIPPSSALTTFEPSERCTV